MVELSAIGSSKHAAGLKDFIQLKFLKKLDWDGPYHVYRNDNWADANKYHQRYPKGEIWDL
jgi:hypothetical protein